MVGEIFSFIYDALLLDAFQTTVGGVDKKDFK